MNINWGRLLVAVIAAYVTYAVLYIGSMFLIFTDMESVMTAIGRGPDDGLQIWVHVGHVLETIIIVLLYFIYVKSTELRTGATFGALMGLYYAATQLTVMGSVKVYPVDLTFEAIPLHIIVGAVVGIVLSKVYRAPSEPVSSAEGE